MWVPEGPLLLQRFTYFWLNVGRKAESRWAVFRVSTVYTWVDCFSDNFSFTFLPWWLCTNYSAICSLPDSSEIFNRLSQAVVHVPSTISSPSCPVDSSRQIRQDSSLEWASDGVRGGWGPSRSCPPASTPCVDSAAPSVSSGLCQRVWPFWKPLWGLLSLALSTSCPYGEIWNVLFSPAWRNKRGLKRALWKVSPFL